MHREIAEALASKKYKTTEKQKVSIDAAELATRVRSRADAWAERAPDEAEDLAAAAKTLEDAKGKVTLGFFDAARLLGISAARALQQE